MSNTAAATVKTPAIESAAARLGWAVETVISRYRDVAFVATFEWQLTREDVIRFVREVLALRGIAPERSFGLAKEVLASEGIRPEGW